MNIRLSQRISKTPPYAFAEIENRVQNMKKSGKRVVDFGVGDPTSPTPEFVINNIGRFATKRNISGYPSYIGNIAFRKACADYMQRTHSVYLNPENEITSTIGSKEAVFHFPLGFIDPGDYVICPTPGYPPYKNGTRFAGGIPYFVPLLEKNDFLIDFESIPKNIISRSKIIWINYPNSPTGKIAPLSWLRDLVSWTQKNNIIIAADEGCYIDIYFDEKPKSILEIQKEGVIAFYSLSKRNNMTGYRTGFCAGDERLISALRTIKTNIDSGTPDFVQDVSILALQDDMHVECMRKEYGKKRGLLLETLRKAGLPECKSDATFYIWQKTPGGMTDLDFAEKLMDLGIIVTPGSMISDADDNGVNPGSRYVRFALVPKFSDIRYACAQIQSNLIQ